MHRSSPQKISRFAIYAWIVLGYNLLVILWGAYVRASGSGAGCGNHWPLCNGEVLPQSSAVTTLIELTHRLTSGSALILIIVLFLWAFRSFPKGHHVRVGAFFSLIFIFTEALVGAGLVLFELVADNASIARALFMSVHLANTFVLLALLTLTAWWATRGQPWQLSGQGIFVWVLAAALAGTVVLGISGAVAALGDTLFPSLSLTEALRQDFSPAAHLLIRLRLMHPLIAAIVSCYLVVAAALAIVLRPHSWTRRFGVALIVLTLVQLGVGLMNVALLAPVWLQLSHLLMADLVWIALVLTTSTVLEQSEETREPVNQLSLHGVFEA